MVPVILIFVSILCLIFEKGMNKNISPGILIIVTLPFSIS